MMAYALTLLGARALDFHARVVRAIAVDLLLDADAPRPGDMIWIREPWRTYVSMDKLDCAEIWHPNADRGAGVRYDAGGPSLSIGRKPWPDGSVPYVYGGNDNLLAFGRLRPAATMPRWASRSCAIIKRRWGNGMLGIDPFSENIDDMIASGTIGAIEA